MVGLADLRLARGAELSDLTPSGGRPLTVGGPYASRAVRHGLTIAGCGYALLFLVAHILGAPTDARQYWSVGLDEIYLQFTENGPGYAYPPPFALLMAPLTTIPYQLFYGGWVAVMVIAALWLVRPLDWEWRLLLLLLVVPELLTGNYHLEPWRPPSSSASIMPGRLRPCSCPRSHRAFQCCGSQHDVNGDPDGRRFR